MAECQGRYFLAKEATKARRKKTSNSFPADGENLRRKTDKEMKNKFSRMPAVKNKRETKTANGIFGFTPQNEKSRNCAKEKITTAVNKIRKR